VKPFDPLEVFARVHAKLTRRRQIKDQQSVLLRGSLEFEIPFQRVYFLDGEVKKDLRLTPSEFKLLYFLATHENESFSREKLLSLVWPKGVHVVSENIYAHVSALRKKLGPGANYIQSIPKVGYRFSIKSHD